MGNIAGEIKKKNFKTNWGSLKFLKNIKTDLVKIKLKESLPRPDLLVENVCKSSCEGKIEMYPEEWI